MKAGFDFCRRRLPLIRKSALFCAAFLLTVLAVSCVKRPSPEQVTAAYFETVASGDMLGIRQYLTPDGQEILDQLSALPEFRTDMESKREPLKELWSGVVPTASQASIEGSRAVVDFTAEVPGRGRASTRIILFLIDGQWRISCIFIPVRPEISRFLYELAALKMPAQPAEAAAPAAPAPAKPAEAAAPAAPAAKPAEAAAAAAKPAAGAPAAAAAKPAAGAEKK